MFALCVHDTWTNKVTRILDRSDNLDYIISYAMEMYNSPRISMWSDLVVMECNKNHQPDRRKTVGYVAYSLDPKTRFMTRIDPVFVMMPRYKKIYKG